MTTKENIERVRHRLILLEDIIENLLSMRRKPLDVLEKKLGQMEDLVVQLSDHDRYDHYFHRYRRKLTSYWEQFCSGEESRKSASSSSSKSASGSASATSSSASTSGRKKSSAVSAGIDRQASAALPSPAVPKPPPKKEKKSLPKLLPELDAELAKVPQVSSQYDLENMIKLANASQTVYDKLKAGTHLGNSTVHNRLLYIATGKLPHLKQVEFEKTGKKSLKVFASFLWTEINLIRSVNLSADFPVTLNRSYLDLLAQCPGSLLGDINLTSRIEATSDPTQPPQLQMSKKEHGDIDALFSTLKLLFWRGPVVHSETDFSGFKALYGTILEAERIMGPFKEHPKVVGKELELDSFVYELSAKKLSTEWFKGHQPSNQKLHFMRSYLKVKIRALESAGNVVNSIDNNNNYNCIPSTLTNPTSPCITNQAAPMMTTSALVPPTDTFEFSTSLVIKEEPESSPIRLVKDTKTQSVEAFLHGCREKTTTGSQSKNP